MDSNAKSRHDRVAFVGDDELPDGCDWAYVTLDDGTDLFVIKASCVTPEALSEAWCLLGAGKWQDVA